jgi:hypothetical protein
MCNPKRRIRSRRHRDLLSAELLEALVRQLDNTNRTLSEMNSKIDRLTTVAKTLLDAQSVQLNAVRDLCIPTDRR